MWFWICPFLIALRAVTQKFHRLSHDSRVWILVSFLSIINNRMNENIEAFRRCVLNRTIPYCTLKSKFNVKVKEGKNDCSNFQFWARNQHLLRIFQQFIFFAYFFMFSPISFRQTSMFLKIGEKCKNLDLKLSRTIELHWI